MNHTSSIRNTALHDLTLIKISVTRYVGTGNSVVHISDKPDFFIFRVTVSTIRLQSDIVYR
jgi:hypothetical protein